MTAGGRRRTQRDGTEKRAGMLGSLTAVGTFLGGLAAVVGVVLALTWGPDDASPDNTPKNREPGTEEAAQAEAAPDVELSAIQLTPQTWSFAGTVSNGFSRSVNVIHVRASEVGGSGRQWASDDAVVRKLAWTASMDAPIEPGVIELQFVPAIGRKPVIFPSTSSTPGCVSTRAKCTAVPPTFPEPGGLSGGLGPTYIVTVDEQRDGTIKVTPKP